jgi:urease accessory protein
VSGNRLLRCELRVPDSAVEPGTPLHVDLRFASDGMGCTWLETQRAGYPFHVGRCLTIAGDPPGMPTVYVQSCSGGIFEHDNLRWQIRAAEGARAHVTTSASTIVHGMEQGEAIYEVLVDAAAGAFLEYLPDPLILFPGARLRNRLRIRVDEGAVVLAWEATLAHDPQGRDRRDGEVCWFDRMDSEMSVESQDRRLLARDRYVLSGRLLAEGRPGVNGPHRCHGSLVVLQRALPAAQMVEALRAGLQEAEGVYAGASSLPNGCGALVRVLAVDAAALRSTLRAAWGAARMLLLGVAPPERRK